MEQGNERRNQDLQTFKALKAALPATKIGAQWLRSSPKSTASSGKATRRGQFGNPSSETESI